MNCDLTAGLGAVSKIPCDETIAQLDDVAIPVMAATGSLSGTLNSRVNTRENASGAGAPLNLATQEASPVQALPYESMTNFVSPSNGNSQSVSSAQTAESTQADPATDEDTARPSTSIPGIEGMGNFPMGPPNVLQDVPNFSVPNNPLLPPGYQEVLDYGSLQYLNGFLRTQIGRYVRVEYIVGSSIIEEMLGYLVGVGINYILLQEISTNNIIAMDFYTVKSVYFYYTKTDLPTNKTK